MTAHTSRRIFIAGACLSLVGSSRAAGWPSKPVRLIVPVAAGSPPDVIARVVSDRLSTLWKQQVIVDNKSGASGIIGMGAIKQAAPDDHVFILAQAATITVTPHVNAAARYDIDADLTPVALVGMSPLVIVAARDFPASTASEFVARARSSRVAVNVGVTGNHSLPHLTAELIKRSAALNFNIVPFPSSGAALTAVVNGDVQVMIDGIPGVDAMLRSDRIKALAVTSLSRLAQMPQVQALSEVIPNTEVNGWFVLFGKKQTSAAVAQTVNQDVNKLMEDKELRAKLLELGVFPRPLFPAQVRDFVDRERKRWWTLIRDLGIKPQ